MCNNVWPCLHNSSTTNNSPAKMLDKCDKYSCIYTYVVVLADDIEAYTFYIMYTICNYTAIPTMCYVYIYILYYNIYIAHMVSKSGIHF